MPIQDTVNAKAAGSTYIYSLTFDPSLAGYSAFAGTLALGVGTNPAVRGRMWQKQTTGFGTDWSLVPLGALKVQGVWDAALDLPMLTATTPPQGYFWIVNVAGTTNLGGITDWQVGDWAVSLGGGNWAKVDNTDLVISVNGIGPVAGNITLNASDIPNDSTVVGVTVADALNTLAGAGATIASTDKFYVDGTLGNDGTADGTMGKPFKTIQACLNFIGQPVTKADYMRTIEVYISDALTSGIGNSPQTWNGVYEENLVVPSRSITFFGDGVKIGNNGASVGFGNILKEYSKSRSFGCSSSDFRPCTTFNGAMNVRDTHNRLRRGMHIGGTCRTSILQRNITNVQGNGSNKINCTLTPGQFPYPITIPTTFPAEPLIRIVVGGTTSYNGLYDITAQIGPTTFEATRVSGSTPAVTVEVGSFFESDSAGASGLTHDAAFIDTYMQGAYTCDDGVVNAGAISAGTEVLYSNNSRFFAGVEGRGILMQRWEDSTLGGATLVNSISGIFNCSISANITTNTLTYATDDMGWMNNRFNSGITFTVVNAGQTIRMDGVTLTSFLAAGCVWAGNTPALAFLDQARGIGNTSLVGGASVEDALNNLLANSSPPSVWYDIRPKNGKVLPVSQPRAYYPAVLYNATPLFFDGTALRKYVAYYGASASAQGYAAFSDDGITWNNETLVTGVQGLAYHASVVVVSGIIHLFYWDTSVTIYSPGATRHATFNPAVSCVAATSDAALTGNYTTGVFADGLRYGTYGPSQIFYNSAPTSNPANPYSYRWCMIHDGTTGTYEGILFATSPDGINFSAFNGTTEVIPRGETLPQKGTLISQTFNYNDTSPKKLFTIPYNNRIISCKIEITGAFNDATATLQVGTLATPNKYMDVSVNVPSVIDVYESLPYDVLAANTDVYVTIVPAAATAGAGVIILEYAPVLPMGWDSHSIGRMNTIIDANGLWHAYYSGGLGTGVGGADMNFGDGIGYATSQDGITWTKYRNNPILFKTESKKGWLRTYTPWVIQDASGYKMYVSFKNSAGTYVTGLVTIGGFY